MPIALALGLGIGHGQRPSSGGGSVSAGVNAEGQGLVASAGSPSVSAGGSGALQPTSLQTSVTYGGATYYFSSSGSSLVPVACECGVYADGQPFVLTQASNVVYDVTPHSVATLDGVAAVGNGLMVDPWMPLVVTAAPQGFEQLQSSTFIDSSESSPWSSSLNLDPSFTGSPISMTTPKSLVKSIRKSGMALVGGRLSDADYPLYQEWCVLHVVSVVPPLGAFAPGASDLDKTSYYTLAKRDKTVLGSGFAISTGMPTLAAAEAAGYFQTGFRPFFGQRSGETSQPMMCQQYNVGSEAVYAAYYSKYWSDWLAAILATGSGVSDAILNKALALGATLIGLSNRNGGTWGEHGAGQHNGRQQFAQLFGHMFEAAVPGTMDKALSIVGNTTGQMFWVESKHVGEEVEWGGGGGNGDWFKSTFYTEHVGMPWFCLETIREVDHSAAVSRFHDAELETEYQFTSSDSVVPELMNILLLKNGPGGKDGSQVIARTTSNFTATNPYAAPIAYIDAFVKIPDVYSPQPVTDARHLAYYNDRRNDCVAPVWHGQPHAFNPDSSPTTYVFAVAGGFGWDFSTLTSWFATETITAYQVQYSQDMMSWVDVVSPGVSGTKTGLTITRTYVRYRRQSASGWSAWSVNHPRIGQVFTGSIALTPAPVLTVAPFSRGTILDGHDITGPGVAFGTKIITQLTNTDPGSVAGRAGTYSVNISQTVASTSGMVAGFQRNVVTPTGTPSASAPAFAVSPKIFKKQYLDYEGPSYIDATGMTLTEDEVLATVLVGTGYVTGYPAPSLTWQKRRSTVLVGSPVIYTSLVDEVGDAGLSITADVVAHNVSGSDATATTGSLTWYGIPDTYAEQMVLFDGVNDKLRHVGDLTGVSDHAKATFFVAFDFTGSPAVTEYIVAMLSITNRIRRTTAGVIGFNWGAASLATLLPNVGGAGRVNLLGTLDNTGTSQLYFWIPGSAWTQATPDTTFDGTALDFTPGASNGWAIGGIDSTSLANLVGASFARVAVWFGGTSGYVHPDITQTTVRGKFSNPISGKIVDPSYSITLMGCQPGIDFYGNAATWNAGTNHGTGGDFVMAGAVTDIAPTPPIIVTYSPADGATGIALSSSLIATYDMSIMFGTGTIRLYDSDDDLIESWDVVTEVGTTAGKVSISGAILSMKTTASMEAAKGHYVQIDATAIDSTVGASFAGISNKTDWNFTSLAPPPVVSSFSPTDGSTTVATNADLIVVYDIPISFGTGTIRLYDSDDDLIESWDVTTEVGTTAGKVGISSATLTMKTTALMESGKGHYVQIDTTAINSAAGGDYPGFSDKTTWNFTTTAATAVTMENMGHVESVVSSATQTLTGFAVDAGDAGKLGVVVIAARSSGSGLAPSSMTICGATGTLVSGTTTDTSIDGSCAIWRAVIGSSPTTSVVATYPSTVASTSGTLFLLTGASATPADSAEVKGTSASTTHNTGAAIDTPTGGVAFFGCFEQTAGTGGSFSGSSGGTITELHETNLTAGKAIVSERHDGVAHTNETITFNSLTSIQHHIVVATFGV